MSKVHDDFFHHVVSCIPVDLSEEVMHGWNNNLPALRRFMSGLGPPEVAPRIELTKVTVPGGTISPYDSFAQAFRAFKRSENFNKFIVRNLSDIPLPIPDTTVGYVDLPKLASVEEVSERFPVGHAFDRNLFLVLLTTRLSHLWRGVHSSHLVFWVVVEQEVFVVHYYYDMSIKRWHGDAQRPGEFILLKDYRAFSAAVS